MMTHKDKKMVSPVKQGPKGYRKIVPDGEKECVWGTAGVVPYKLCEFNFDCGNCAFDMVMRGGYDLAPSKVSIRGNKLCPLCFYHQCHTWATVEENAHIRIGIDDFGQNLLGEIQSISLPMKDEKLGNKSIRIKSRGGIVSIIPPVDGYVVEVNEDLLTQPSLVNKYPYEGGWLVVLRPARLAKNLKQLFYGDSAIKWFDDEIVRLCHAIAEETDLGVHPDVGDTLQDGGALNFDCLESMPPAKTKKILERFFIYRPIKK